MGYNDTRIAALVNGGFHTCNELTHFRARSEIEKESIFRLRYESYLREGLIEENENKALYDQYDDAKCSLIYGIRLKHQLVSTIRMNVLDLEKRASSSYDVFRDYFDPILESGATIVDGTRLAVNCRNWAERRKVLMYTLSLTALFAYSHEIDLGAIAVREDHVPFYERFGFHVVGTPRLFTGIKFRRSLMMLRLNQPKLVSTYRPTQRAEASKLEEYWAAE